MAVRSAGICTARGLVMEILGHRPVRLTADTSDHITLEVQQVAAERMDNPL
jgi:hypothetical protein